MLLQDIFSTVAVGQSERDLGGHGDNQLAVLWYRRADRLASVSLQPDTAQN